MSIECNLVFIYMMTRHRDIAMNDPVIRAIYETEQERKRDIEQRRQAKEKIKRLSKQKRLRNYDGDLPPSTEALMIRHGVHKVIEIHVFSDDGAVVGVRVESLKSTRFRKWYDKFDNEYVCHDFEVEFDDEEYGEEIEEYFPIARFEDPQLASEFAYMLAENAGAEVDVMDERMKRKGAYY